MSKKFKLVRPGEGTRERRKSRYGDGGRAVGGAARNQKLKASVSKKGAVSKTKAAVPSLPPVVDNLPEPGGHPSDLTQRAKAEGHDVAGGRDNAFSKLAALTKRSQAAKAKAVEDQATKPRSGPVQPERVSDELLDNLFGNRSEKLRPTEGYAEKQARLERMKTRLPILRKEDTHALQDSRVDHTGRTEPSQGSVDARHPDSGADATHARADGPTPSAHPRTGDSGADPPTSGDKGGNLLASRVGAGTGAQTAQGDRSGAGGESGSSTSGDRGELTNGEGRQTSDSAGKDHLLAQHAGQEGQAPPTTTALIEAEERSQEAQAAIERGRKTPYTLSQKHELAGIMGMPGVICNRCPAAESCPEFQENSSCAYDEYFSGLSSRDVDNLLPSMESFADMQASRARRAVFLEQRVTGGQIDPNVSRQIAVAMDAQERVARLKGAFATANKKSVTVIAQEGSGQPKQGGILTQLLAGITGAAPQQESGELVINEEGPEVIDTTASVTVKAEQQEIVTDVLKEQASENP